MSFFIGCGEVAEEIDSIVAYQLKKIFGENWNQPEKLIVCPQFIANQYRTWLAEGNHLQEVKLKLEFFNIMNEILKDETAFEGLSGYLVFDFDLKALRDDDHMQVHAALFSRNICIIFELVDDDDDNFIEEAENKLSCVVHALNTHIDDRIPVKGVIVFPFKTRLCTSIVSSDDSVLYKDDLKNSLKSFSHSATVSDSSHVNATNALGELLQVSFIQQHHPETEQEAICQAAQRCFLQKPEMTVTRKSQIDFSIMKPTDIQNDIRSDLHKGDTLLWGGYGIGKSIAIMFTVKDLIKQYKQSAKQKKSCWGDFKILFLSGQSLLGDADLRLSPFLLMIEKWIKDICQHLRYSSDLRIVNYTHFLERDIKFVMGSKAKNKGDIRFYSYLLKTTDLEILNEHSSLLNNFDIVVVEETHAVQLKVFHGIVKGLEKARKENEERKGRNVKIWITSNNEGIDLKLPGFNITPGPLAKPSNLRNTPAVVNLAEAINNDIGPERYPSTTMSVSSIKCHIGVSYDFEWNDKERLKRVVKEAKKWTPYIPNSSLLFIDCERSSLYEELLAENIPLKKYKDEYHIGEPLFLQHSDPIEAIVAGAEWHVLFVHIKVNTVNSIEVIKLFTKRIISRITTKVFIFSDKNLHISPNEINQRSDDEINQRRADRKRGIENSLSTQKLTVPESRHSDDGCSEGNKDSNAKYSSCFRISEHTNDPTDNKINCLKNTGNLIEKIRMLHEKISSSDEKSSHYNGYDFTQIRHLDVSLKHESKDIYLVHGRGNAFIVHLNSHTKSEVLKAQKVLETIWKVRVPAYCDSEIVSPCRTENIACLLKLFYLLQPKASFPKNNDSGFISVSSEEADEFAKKGKSN